MLNFSESCIVCINFMKTIGVEELKKKNDPWKLGRHSLVSELRLTITYEFGWGYPPVFSDTGLS